MHKIELVDVRCTEAFLSIYHKGLDPNEVTKLLGVSPTHTQDPKNGSFGEWNLSTLHNLESDYYGHHIEWLLDKISGSKQGIQQLNERGIEVILYCKLFARGLQTLFVLETDQMSRMSDLGLLFQCELLCLPLTESERANKTETD